MTVLAGLPVTISSILMTLGAAGFIHSGALMDIGGALMGSGSAFMLLGGGLMGVVGAAP